jgi:nitrate reductase beta subunit
VSAESAEASGRSLADIATIVRRYSSTGSLELEVRNIPLDYYIPPVTPFRVQSDVLYQLVPRLDAVTINVWDLR